MSKVYRVDTATKQISGEEFKKEYQFYGNRGLTAKVLTQEVDPKCDPLGAENKLVVCTEFLGYSSIYSEQDFIRGQESADGGNKRGECRRNLRIPI